MDIFTKIMTFVDRVQGALEAVRRVLPLTLVRSYDVGLRRICVLLEVFDGLVAAPLATDGPRSMASLAPFPRDAASAEAPGSPQGEGREAAPPRRLRWCWPYFGALLAQYVVFAPTGCPCLWFCQQFCRFCLLFDTSRLPRGPRDVAGVAARRTVTPFAHAC